MLTFGNILSCSALYNGRVIKLSVVIISFFISSHLSTLVKLLQLLLTRIMVLCLGCGGGLLLDWDNLLNVVVHCHVCGGRDEGAGAGGGGYHRSLGLRLGWFEWFWLRLAGLLGSTALVLSQTLHSEILSHGEEGVEFVLGHVHLPVIHEVEHSLEVGVTDPLHVEERMLVRVPPENVLEERTAGGEDDFVSVDLFIIAGQGHIKEIFVFSQLSERSADVRLKIIPFETKLVGAHLDWLLSRFLFVFLLLSVNLCWSNFL